MSKAGFWHAGCKHAAPGKRVKRVMDFQDEAGSSLKSNPLVASIGRAPPLAIRLNKVDVMARFLVLLAALCLGAWSAVSVAQDRPQIALTPTSAFSGRSEGNGTLKILLGRKKPYRVESSGTVQSDGHFRLDQTVVFLGDPPRRRTWVITQASPLHYVGTLSDAAGRVVGETQGRRLMLRYRLKGPLVMHQALELMADGKTIDNVGCITLLGIPVGHLHEIIERAGP